MAGSYVSESFISPIAGFTDRPDLLAPAQSIVSGQNLWVLPDGLQPRHRLSGQTITSLRAQNLGGNAPVVGFFGTTNPSSTGTRVLGVVPFVSSSDSNGQRAPLWVSGTSNALVAGFYDTSASSFQWWALSLTTRTSYASVTTASPPSLRTDANWRGAAVYSAPLNDTLLVLTAGSVAYNAQAEKLLATLGSWTPSVGLVSALSFSRLSGAVPAAIDVVNFADRVVAWNCDGVPQRVQWHVEGDPTDWVGIGSGFQDLADMRGFGTRIFSEEDEMVLASSEELWRGRYVGLPYVFSFSAIDRQQGMPYERATLQTSEGIFWLDKSLAILQMQREQIVEVAPPVRRFLKGNLKAPDVAFLTYDQERNHLSLFYSTTTSSYPTHSVTIDLDNKVWTHEVYSHVFHCGVSEPLVEVRGTAGAGTTSTAWDAPFYLGVYSAVVTSNGTFGVFTQSATSDLGSSVLEQGTFGTLQHPDLTTFKNLQELRIDVAARSASSISFGFSADNGATFPASYETTFNVSASSNASQYISYPQMSANYFTPRIRSTNGNWVMRRWYGRFEDGGKAV